MKETCQRLNISGQVTKNRNSYTNVLVDSKHKVLYCFVPKILSSVWRNVIVLTTSNFTVEYLTSKDEPKFQAFNVYDRSWMINTVGLQYLNGLPQNIIQEKLQTYKKMIIVRNPFVRLFSGYADKLVMKRGPDPKWSVIDNVFPEAPQINKHKFITFPQFLELITKGHNNTSPPLKAFARDHHWTTINSLCSPCQIEYDYIAKLETFDEDKVTLFKLFNATDRQLLSSTFPTRLRSHNVFNYTLPSVEKAFQDVPESTMSAIRKIFRHDIELFGYGYSKAEGLTCGYGNSSCC